MRHRVFMTERTVQWQGVDDPERFDEATIRLGIDALSAEGTSRTPHYRLHWSLQTGARWVTRSLMVQVVAPAWSRRLDLRRSEDGRWSADGAAVGVPVTADGQPLVIDGSAWSATDGTEPGIEDPASIVGADDCDLGLCPVTNTMPMLRSVLRPTPDVAPGPEIEFVMAWIEVPSLRVIRSEQIYQLRRMGGSTPGGGAVVRYVGLHRSFEGDLTVDADGVVIDYPELARRIDPVAQ